jgi:TolA-binding protein
MRKILPWLFILVFTASLARAQDDAAQQQIDKLSGQVQDLLDAQSAQGKRIEALEKKIGDLGDKINQPGGNNFAGADDLKNLAAQVQEIDKKRQDDNEKILDALEKLGKGGSVSSVSHKPLPTVSTASTDNSTPPSTGPQKGYEYKIAPSDTLSAIAKAYHAQGVKVTVEQIQNANPGLNPKNMTVGKTIFIPDANAK